MSGLRFGSSGGDDDIQIVGPSNSVQSVGGKVRVRLDSIGATGKGLSKAWKPALFGQRLVIIGFGLLGLVALALVVGGVMSYTLEPIVIGNSADFVAPPEGTPAAAQEGVMTADEIRNRPDIVAARARRAAAAETRATSIREAEGYDTANSDERARIDAMVEAAVSRIAVPEGAMPPMILLGWRVANNSIVVPGTPIADVQVSQTRAPFDPGRTRSASEELNAGSGIAPAEDDAETPEADAAAESTLITLYAPQGGVVSYEAALAGQIQPGEAIARVQPFAPITGMLPWGMIGAALFLVLACFLAAAVPRLADVRWWAIGTAVFFGAAAGIGTLLLGGYGPNLELQVNYFDPDTTVTHDLSILPFYEFVVLAAVAAFVLWGYYLRGMANRFDVDSIRRDGRNMILVAVLIGFFLLVIDAPRRVDPMPIGIGLLALSVWNVLLLLTLRADMLGPRKTIR